MVDRSERLDELIDQVLGRGDPASGDDELDPLLGVVVDLVDLPRESFRTRLKRAAFGLAAVDSTAAHEMIVQGHDSHRPARPAQ